MQVESWVNDRYKIARREQKAREYIRANRIANIKEALLVLVMFLIPIIFGIVLLAL